MWPRIGALQTYTIAYTVSMLTHVALSVWYCRRSKLSLKGGVALGLCFIWGMNMGAHILYDMRYHRFDWHNYLNIDYYFQDGMWGGPLAYLAVAVAGVVILARDRRAWADVVALSLPIPLMLAKVACFTNGCCYGAPCALPWAVAFPEGGPDCAAPPGVWRHPTQLYEVLGLAVMAVVLARLRCDRRRGTLLPWFVLLYGLMRPLTEFFRAPAERDGGMGLLSASQIVCLASAVVAGAWLVAVNRRAAHAHGAAPASDVPADGD